ncbi:MAG: ribulose-phosphate 3-epimerase [Bacteroidales bacterium]|nr:ribulose-phosphate 3-epimerase [Bacteroidales bacterium]HPY81767.1 ribulose-phosphate 3-epimerase [Bacteroidales bacterium]
MPIISPSLLSADFAFLKQEIDFINSSAADWFHLDIMDGVFVPNISFGLPLVETIKKYAKKPLDIHLMITNPDLYIERFKNAGADWLTVHIEACTHAHRTIHAIKKLGIKAGISLNPHTPINSIENIITDVDMVLIMSVNPGFGGQSFIPQSIQKIKELKKLIQKTNSQALIQVDGGIDTTNAKQIVAAGADVLVAGNSIFTSSDRNATVQFLKDI